MTSRRIGAFLAVWSAGFAAVHVAWALGWRGGVPLEAEPISGRPELLAYDLAAAVLMLAAAYVAARLARGGLPHRTRRRLVQATLGGSVVALLRGLPALVVHLATGTSGALGPAVDMWFAVAGVAGLLLWRAVRREDPVMAEPDLSDAAR
jgi:hypothetical protein